MAKRMTIANFKEKASAKFNNKFNYDKVTFIHSKEAVPIICPIHGEFLQRPSLHLKSMSGCAYCAGVGKKTTDDFIKEAEKVHENKYSYKKSEYKDSKKKLIIICHIHGDFQQIPSSHIIGRGCPECGSIQSHNTSKKSTKEFIEEAKKIHGEKYYYSKALYKNIHSKVELICNIKGHGSFLVTPANHLRKDKPQGCPYCSKRRKISTDEFIKEAQDVHGNKYTYENTIFIAKNKKVKINCPEHGKFEQQAGVHLRGSGCSYCGRKKIADIMSLSTEEFIEKAKTIHDNKYIYSKVTYKSAHEKVLITCPIHGDFEQSPSSHLQGHRCSKCSGNYTIKNIKDFIKKVTEKHSNTYNYSRVKFNSVNDVVTIICPVHGEFKQKARNHFRSGCPKCGGSYKLDTKTFINKANIIHDNLYSYENAIYKNSSTKIEINCPYHGSFLQLPPSHLKGHGCPTCKNSRGEFRIEKYLKLKRQVSYENQYTFDDCRNVYPLPFDFAILKENKMGLVEFNGEQHYQEINFGHKKEIYSDLVNIQIRDRIKKEYCENNNLPLLIIRYDQLDEIDKLLDEFIIKIMGE